MRGNKLADIVISPRDSDASASWIGAGLQKKPSVSSYKSLQPATQRAPPVQRPGQSGSQSRRLASTVRDGIRPTNTDEVEHATVTRLN